MESLLALVGKAVSCQELCRQLCSFAERHRAPVVGAMQVTCADESERECIDAFQQEFSDPLLPNLKFGERSHFRLANLGARYEWGAVRIAEEHFATPASIDSFKLMVVKINAHVSVERRASGLRFGRMQRYESDSVYCGALHSLMDGAALPVHAELREIFSSEGKNRLGALLDPARVDPQERSLLAAVVSARLQARQALIDIQDFTPTSPTLYFVFPCVTLNRKEEDEEILCGVYEADCRSPEATVSYLGLGDEPSSYRVRKELGRIRVEDGQMGSRRAARDHRRLLLAQWEQLRRGRTAGALAEHSSGPEQGASADRLAARKELEEILEEVRRGEHGDLVHSRRLLRTLLKTLARLDPVGSAVHCFGEGIAAIHHIHRVDRLSRGLTAVRSARKVLDDIHRQVDSLSPERARDVIDILTSRYRTERR